MIFTANAMISSSSNRFFKIILNSTLHRGKLNIPNKFRKKYERDLSNPVFLNPPDGTRWKVHWTKHNDGGICFEAGWKDFATHYSLRHGHFLVFKYKKNTCDFGVHIFDMSATGIDYPIHGNDKEGSEEEKKKKKKASSSSSSSRRAPLPNIGALKNPYFLVNIKEKQDGDHRPCVPRRFVRDNFDSKDTLLKLLHGNKLWCVNLYAKYQCKLTKGWFTFAKENELVAGDTCVFELIKRKDALFRVHIFRAQS